MTKVDPYTPPFTHAPRIGGAWQAIRLALADGKWHVRRSLPCGDVAPRTRDNLIRAARRAGAVETHRRHGLSYVRLCPPSPTASVFCCGQPEEVTAAEPSISPEGVKETQ